MSERVQFSISIIVPAFNAETKIAACLDAIENSISGVDEVIVVNDASTDSTASISSKHNCKIINLTVNGGAAHARNHGAIVAKKDLILFIDSDVVVTKENIEQVRSYFSQHSNVHTITANVDIDNQNEGFLTDFKNLYMGYIISDGNLSVNYVYGSFCATRRNGYVAWPEHMRMTEDSLWGYQQKKLNLVIHSLDFIKVKHLKTYSFKSLVKNDFLISSFFSRAFLDFKRWGTLYSRENFGHTSKIQKLSVILAMASLLVTLVFPMAGLGIFAFWLMLNTRFFQYLFVQRGIVFSIKSVAWYYFACINYFIGITYGFFQYFMEKSSFTEEREIA